MSVFRISGPYEQVVLQVAIEGGALQRVVMWKPLALVPPE